MFFNSLGGSTNQAATIGRTLRQYRMRAGVARSIPEGCRPALGMNGACSRLGVIELEGLNVSRTFELSTAGLTDALGLLQKRCDKREDPGTAAAAPTH